MVTASANNPALTEICGLARAAGSEILKVYQSDFAVEHKDDKSPLTLADRRSHDIINSFLKQHSPYPVLSEEGKDIPYDERKTWASFWLVDPLDGTKEFIKRNGEFTVNIALIRRCAPVLGVIFAPAKDVLYYAVKTEGAYKEEDGKTVKLPRDGEHPGLTVVGSRSHATPEFDEYVRTLRNKRGDVSFLSAGSSLKFCLVAEGKADIYPRLGPTMEWDTAAGQILVEETGGAVVDAVTKTPLAYNRETLLNNNFIAYRGKGAEYA